MFKLAPVEKITAHEQEIHSTFVLWNHTMEEYTYRLYFCEVNCGKIHSHSIPN
jgi:hypothetical protein